MMPGPHVPPAVPIYQGRRHGEYYPPQTHSPVHNPYANFHPQYHGPPHASPYQQQWYPYHQPQHQHQYSMPPRQYQPQSHGSPVVVSSHPPMQPVAPVSRQLGQTPPIAHSRTPPVPRNYTPQQAPSTPSVASQAHVSPPSTTTTMTTPEPPPSASSRPSFSAPPPPQPTHRTPFAPPLPWLSVPELPFPPKASNKRRRRRGLVASTEEGLAFPAREQTDTPEEGIPEPEQTDEQPLVEEPPAVERAASPTSTAAPVSELETPATSQAPSEADSTHPTTPSSVLPPAPAPRPAAPSSHTRSATKTAVPLIPIKPAVPKVAPSVTSTTQKSVTPEKTDKPASEAQRSEKSAGSEQTPTASPPASKPAPKSWAELLRSKPAPATAQSLAVQNGVVTPNGSAKSNSLGDVLTSFSVDAKRKLAFLQPRGLVNTGNMCYMNSILQVLVFCIPFYDFLDQVHKRAVHNFKSETPLVDAITVFMRDFSIIDSADSAEKLRLRLKDNELEQYGDPLTPEYVYDVIRRLPRFDHMKRGHQQDAEEFLGFLLAGLHDECAHVMKGARPTNGAESAEITSPTSEKSAPVDGGWLEVGPKQKSAVTQSSGTIEVESPITKIFGGKLRSEYKRHGQKTTVTLEPYQPLQLDIGAPNVNNITDALRGLTHLETLQGDSNAPQGTRSATKQLFIETLPPVLILHLKRFLYDATGGTQKIWKKVGYPLELEIPKEVFPPHKRSAFAARGGLPRYRLTAVVYHHGKNASGGHYTVDVRRQEGREWIRMDDTVIRRIRADVVAEGGAEEDPKILAAALEQHKRDSSRSRNFYEQVGLEEEGKADDQGGWSQVNGTEKTEGSGAGKTKKWSGVVNGTATPSSAGKRTPTPASARKEGVREGKVAYILFYSRIEA
ncbi:cysteine proteinase [Mytilinidion resinicola]|uniref:Ubiquitin carboxyl-terminal hydrolase n=1 Tax=Mytilinidion resinicola TaxID=574789 RepID=A0A6A6Y8M5_9PEZI|nr:cysteine proteinase [Mytilinidion resinicola]KAF2805186.1 cysteine proteinase [Mytilinidion resinicola]